MKMGMVIPGSSHSIWVPDARLFSVLLGALVLGVLANPATVHAAPQAGGPQIKQSVSKAAAKPASQTKVDYHGTPHFASIRGTAITYTTNAHEPVLYTGEAFYFLFSFYNPNMKSTQEVWVVSENPQGPWVPAHYIPQIVTEIVCAETSTDPYVPYQLCALPFLE